MPTASNKNPPLVIARESMPGDPVTTDLSNKAAAGIYRMPRFRFRGA
jgi:hypothetical protein